MLALWMGLAMMAVFQRDWPALGVLTLTVVAAIVQLRWLASQVSSLVSMTHRSAEDALIESAKVPDLPRDAGAAHEPGADCTPQEPLGGPTTQDRTSYGPRGVAASPDGVVLCELAEADELDHADYDDSDFLDSDSPTGSVPGVSRISILRPAVLFGGLLFVFAIGSSEPIALAAGVLTLPAALMIEAFATAIKSRQ